MIDMINKLALGVKSQMENQTEIDMEKPTNIMFQQPLQALPGHLTVVSGPLIANTAGLEF